MFNIKDFLIKSIIKSYEEGSMGEGQVGMTTMQYFLKGMLTEEDVDYINETIEEMKAEKIRLKEQREQEEKERLEQEERDRIEWEKAEAERLEQEKLEEEPLD